MRVGFIGLGHMGNPMAHNLLKAGFELVVHDIVESAVNKLVDEGATAASSPAEAARRSEIVLTCLPTVASVEEVYLGKGGLIPNARKGQVLADHSTVTLDTSLRLARESQARGVCFLDAPISGGEARAADATLTIMVGGDPGAYKKARPLLEAMGKTVRLMGPSGAGTVTKLINQHLVAVNGAAASEALVLAAKSGIQLRPLLELLSTAWGNSVQLQRVGERVLTRDFSGGATNYILAKDIRCVQDLARSLGASAPLLEVTAQLMNDTMAMGFVQADFATMVVPLEKKAGIEVRG